MLALGHVLLTRVQRLQNTRAIRHAQLFIRFLMEADQSCLPLCVSCNGLGGDAQHE